jgi:hypothetical protein
VLALALILPASVGAASVEDRLEKARQGRREAVAQAAAAADQLAALATRYRELEAEAEAAAARLVDAYLRETALQARLAQARAVVDDRAASAYKAGPATILTALLDADSFGDLLARHEMIERVFLSDVEEAVAALDQRGRARLLRVELEVARADLQARQEELEGFRSQMEARLSEARAAAHRAGGRVAALEVRLRELEAATRAAARSAARRQSLLEAGTDQATLLRMLGPAGGRGCAIPDALVATGETMSGEASFYGDEFAGQPTASGAIFVPELFTAAHRTLPLPSFLHVRFGGRCATVLVNDRGPYVAGRFLDLSEGAARYLGLPGIGQVEAEILAPR